jgi:uncharacterized protein
VIVVADSSPLIYLSRVGILHLLAIVWDDVVVPRAVWDEVVQRRPSAPGVDDLRHASWIRVDDSELPDVDLGLDPGETAAIVLAETIHADVLLIDERMGRRVAESRGIAIRGTLGFLVQAHQVGALPALRPILDALVAEGFRVAPALIRETLSRVGELAEPSSTKSKGRS